MEDETLVDRLVSLGVFEEADNQVSLTASFTSTIDKYRRELSNDDAVDVIDRMRTDDELLQIFLDDSETDRRYLSIALSLEATLREPLTREWTGAIPVIDHLAGTQPRSSGAPDMFFPVHGDRLKPLLELYSRSIVYIWREDCEPCDTMLEALEEALVDPPEDVRLFAVYGPDYVDALWEEYDAYGAPIILFVRDGEVDTRLVGIHHQAAVENEIEILQETEHPA